MDNSRSNRRQKWHTFDPTDLSTLSPRAGCYVVAVGGVAAYVGQSDNVRRRFRQHACVNVPGASSHFDGYTQTPWGAFDWRTYPVEGKVCYPRRYGEHLMIEARLIRRLAPAFNTRGHVNGR